LFFFFFQMKNRNQQQQSILDRLGGGQQKAKTAERTVIAKVGGNQTAPVAAAPSAPLTLSDRYSFPAVIIKDLTM
jgi:hypothetical protein